VLTLSRLEHYGALWLKTSMNDWWDGQPALSGNAALIVNFKLIVFTIYDYITCRNVNDEFNDYHGYNAQ